MIVDRYLVRQLLTPFLAGWLLLTVVYAAFIASIVLADAAAGEISAGALWRLIGLRCVIAAEVLVPTSMFFAVLFTFERLNRDRELVALLVGGLSRLRLLRPLAGLGLLLLIGVTVLALVARPWAYRTTYMVEDRAARVEMEALRPGSFHSLGPDLVVTANGVDDDGRLLDVFARQELPSPACASSAPSALGCFLRRNRAPDWWSSSPVRRSRSRRRRRPRPTGIVAIGSIDSSTAGPRRPGPGRNSIAVPGPPLT
ncbi:MAG: LptF/LptG family permease [Gammaproteobacteria bacterium]|nr:LptF/LptG family permease [Gammaproteobacteria bacterium]